ncbi:MAG: DegV family protein, partial [Oscillospiraceae bacterium]
DFYQSFMKAENTLCFTMTGTLSGTNNCAQVAKKMVQETHPEKNIHVIDTHATAGIMTLLARKTDELIKENLTFQELTKQLDEYCASLHLVFTLAQFDNLVKSGRMNAIAGAIASHLGIRAVAVNSPKGEIEVVKKVRGEEKAMAAMVEIMCETKEMKGKPVAISQCQNKEGAEFVKKLIREKCGTNDITIYECKALTTFYAMEKGLIISY